MLFVVIGAIVGNKNNAGTGSAPSSDSTASGCSDDWQKCSDNADLVNNWSGWSTIQVECESSAEQQAKYGTPKWPWIPFGSFHPGTNYIQTGVVTAIEPDAQFQNGFGAMAHVKVYCQYDLRKKSVLSVFVDEN